jgi:hypothetical protein
MLFNNVQSVLFNVVEKHKNFFRFVPSGVA